MHAIAFQAKRVHLCTVAFGHHVLKKVRGMTAARFDLLCLLRQASLGLTSSAKTSRDPLKVGVTQKEIIQRLDLCRSTVSKMLARLEEMGWIRRARDRNDRRVKRVFFTPTGLRRTWHAMRTVFRQRALLARFEELFKLLQPRTHVVQALRDFWNRLHAVAKGFGDRSLVHYDLGTDDQNGDPAFRSRRASPRAVARPAGSTGPLGEA